MSRFAVNPNKHLLYYIIIILLFMPMATIAGSNTVNRDDMFNKVMCGYQGWFGAPGDGSPAWDHWCITGFQPMPNTITIDMWPDYTDYPANTLYYSNAWDWRYPDGSRAGFYSSNMQETVLLHCKWMRDYGIDGVFLQRFTARLREPVYKTQKNKILKYMLQGAKLYNLSVVVMYDVTGTPIKDIAQILTQDWVDLTHQMKLQANPFYQYHPDRFGRKLPLVAVWGLGFLGSGTKGQAAEVIDFFKNNEDDRYRATLMGGVPGYWRSGQLDSKEGYEHVYAGFDIISPWTVGRFAHQQGVETWRTTMMEADMALTGSRGQQYLPVCFPGFSNANLRKNQLDKKSEHIPTLNEIPRDGGHFMWSQFYHWFQAGNRMLYIAMFDEVDEGTAIFKVAADAAGVPDENLFLHLGVDGYNLESDHYLWMTGTAGFILKHGLPFPVKQPQRYAGHMFQVEALTERTLFHRLEYMEINVRLENPSASRFVIYKKTTLPQLPAEQEGFRQIVSFQPADLQNGSFRFVDKDVEANRNYTYLLVGLDDNNFPVGLSKMERPLATVD